MALSAHSVKLRSLGLWSLVLAALPLSVGCIIVQDDPPPQVITYDDGNVPPTDDPMLVSIDTDAVVTSEPGEGVGIFVEYAADGRWRVSTTCDTNYSDYACTFDVFASVDTMSDLTDFAEEDLEGSDRASLIEDGVLGFHAVTDTDLDAVSFTTTPGAIVRLEAYLDGYSQPRFVYWFGKGVLHEGAPTNPVDFEPTSP